MIIPRIFDELTFYQSAGTAAACLQKEQYSFLFLSPPVRMHGGLLCIVFCMYVCLSVT